MSKKINVYERSIEFYNVSMEEAGLYTCLAENEVGVSEEMAVLTVVPSKFLRNEVMLREEGEVIVVFLTSKALKSKAEVNKIKK